MSSSTRRRKKTWKITLPFGGYWSQSPCHFGIAPNDLTAYPPNTQIMTAAIRPDLRIGTGFHDERFIAGIFQGCYLRQEFNPSEAARRYHTFQQNWRRKTPGIFWHSVTIQIFVFQLFFCWNYLSYLSIYIYTLLISGYLFLFLFAGFSTASLQKGQVGEMKAIMSWRLGRSSELTTQVVQEFFQQVQTYKSASCIYYI